MYEDNSELSSWHRIFSVYRRIRTKIFDGRWGSTRMQGMKVAFSLITDADRDDSLDHFYDDDDGRLPHCGEDVT